jgi:hypothetical protein
VAFIRYSRLIPSKVRSGEINSIRNKMLVNTRIFQRYGILTLATLKGSSLQNEHLQEQIR